MFPSAPQPDIFRSVQKDDHFLSQFRSDCRDFAANALGNRAAHKEAEIDLIASLLYYSSSYFKGVSTLGEEYCDILPVVRGPQRWETLKAGKRISVLIARTIIPYIYHKIQRNGAAYQVSSSSLEENSPSPSSRIKKFLASWWNRLISLILQSNPAHSTLQRVHLCLFYLFGAYLEFSLRFNRVRYVSIQAIHPPRPNYRIFGIFLVIQGILQGILILKGLYSSYRENSITEAAGSSVESSSSSLVFRPLGPEFAAQLAREAQEREEEESIPANPTGFSLTHSHNCTVCLEPRKCSTLTECGHVFCWSCITESCRNRPECPLCRRPCKLKDLLLLSHYR